MDDSYEEEVGVRDSLYAAGDDLLEWTGCEGPVASVQCRTRHWCTMKTRKMIEP